MVEAPSSGFQWAHPTFPSPLGNASLERLLALVFALLLLLVPGKEAQADIVHLKNGRKLRGQIIDAESDEDWLVIEVPTGRVQFRRREIAQIERESKADYLIKKGLELSANDAHEDAIEVLREALEAKAPEAQSALVTALIRRGRSLLKKARPGAAASDFQEALSLDPKNSIAQKALSDSILQGRSLEDRLERAARSRDLDQAISELEALLREDPGRIEKIRPLILRFRLARAEKFWEALKRDPAKRDPEALAQTAADYDRIFSLNPDELARLASSWALCRVLLQDSGASPQSARILDQAAQLSRGAISACAEAMAREVEGASARAEELWQGLIPEPALSLSERRRKAIERALEEHSGRVIPSAKPVESSVRTPFRLAQSKQFRIFHRNPELATELARVAEYSLSRRLKDVGEVRGRLQGEKIDVYVYANKAEYHEKGGPPGSVGVTETQSPEPGLFRIVIRVYEEPQLLASTMPHEVLHAALPLALGHNDLPLWLHEGLASAFEPELKAQFYASIVANAAARSRLIPLERLMTATRYPDEGRVTLFYAESLLLAQELLARGRMSGLLSKSRDLRGSPEEIARVLKESFRVKSFKQLEDLMLERISGVRRRD